MSSLPTALTTLQPMLVGRGVAARLCGVSPASWDRLVSADRTPAPLKLNGRVLFCAHDLASWVSLDLPDGASFEAVSS